jgi:hypothetical protein
MQKGAQQKCMTGTPGWSETSVGKANLPSAARLRSKCEESQEKRQQSDIVQLAFTLQALLDGITAILRVTEEHLRAWHVEHGVRYISYYSTVRKSCSSTNSKGRDKRDEKE